MVTAARPRPLERSARSIPPPAEPAGTVKIVTGSAIAAADRTHIVTGRATEARCGREIVTGDGPMRRRDGCEAAVAPTQFLR